MRYFNFFFFSLFLILISMSCGADYNNSGSPYSIENPTLKKADIEQQKAINTKSSELDPTEIDAVENRYSSEVRGQWQQPYLVMDMFGDLEGKTIADIGAGPEGYFTLLLASATKVKKVIALDIDQKALDFINDVKKELDESIQQRIETRLAENDNAKLKMEEADDVLISETLVYIDDPIAYLSQLRKGMKKGGKLLIIDFKMKQIPSLFPPVEERMPLYKMENIIQQAGFKLIQSDDMSLPFHYMVLGENG